MKTMTVIWQSLKNRKIRFIIMPVTVVSIILIALISICLAVNPKSNSAKNSSPLADTEDNTMISNDSGDLEVQDQNTVTSTTISIIGQTNQNNQEGTKKPADKTDNIKDTSATKQQSGEFHRYKGFFSKSAFIGDSITEGLSSFELIDDSNVAANKGYTVLKAKKDIDNLVKGSPDRIFILLGANDVLYDMSSERYVSDYSQLIDILKSRVPNARIYIQSIFPVSAKIEQQKPMMRNSRIDEFNIALKKTAEEHGAQFLDVASLLRDDKGCMREEYTSDGIHLKYKFYGLWLDYLKNSSN